MKERAVQFDFENSRLILGQRRVMGGGGNGGESKGLREECFDGRQNRDVSRKPINRIQRVLAQPSGARVLGKLQVARFNGAIKTVHCQVEVRIVVFDGTDQRAHMNKGGQFLSILYCISK